MAHLGVASGSGDGDGAALPWRTAPDRAAGVAAPGSGPWLLPVPSAWWETPAVITKALSGRPEEARTARRFVREMLGCWGLGALADDAEMIAGELVANAVLHGTGAGPGHGSPPCAMSVLRLCLLRRIGEVMIAVVDPGDETPVPRMPGWAGEDGRGLQLVAALSHVWGWSPIAGHGKAVWAVLRDP